MKNCLLNGKVTPSGVCNKQTRSGVFHLFLLILFSSFSTSLIAQKIVTGRVTSADSSLSGVTVQVKGKANATVTDENGKFSISAPANGTLVFSSVGYSTVEEKVNNRNTINVQLSN